MKSENECCSLAFDVGHSSIGWAVVESRGVGPSAPAPSIRGCGVVTFPADDCLASQRRIFRRQRRHVRSTRQRIERLGNFKSVVRKQSAVEENAKVAATLRASEVESRQSNR